MIQRLKTIEKHFSVPKAAAIVGFFTLTFADCWTCTRPIICQQFRGWGYAGYLLRGFPYSGFSL